MTATGQKTDVVWLVSIPEIPRHGTLYEDIDSAYTQARRVFYEDQADRFESRVELFERINDPMRNETRDFQNDIKAINEESWPVYTSAPENWKPAPIVKHDNSKVRLMPQRGLKQTSAGAHCVSNETRAAVHQITKPFVKLLSVGTDQPPKAVFTLADGKCVFADGTTAKHIPEGYAPVRAERAG